MANVHGDSQYLFQTSTHENPVSSCIRTILFFVKVVKTAQNANGCIHSKVCRFRFVNEAPCSDETCQSYDDGSKKRNELLTNILAIIKKQDDEICGSYGLWEMNSTQCHSFQGNCTLCKITKAIEMFKEYPEEFLNPADKQGKIKT